MNITTNNSNQYWPQVNDQNTTTGTINRPPHRAKIDTDQNGSVSQSEFQTFADQLSEKLNKKIDSNEIFSQFDTNRDNQLSKDEMKNVFKSNSLPFPEFHGHFSHIEQNPTATDSIDTSAPENTNLTAITSLLNPSMNDDSLLSTITSDDQSSDVINNLLLTSVTQSPALEKEIQSLANQNNSSSLIQTYVNQLINSSNSGENNSNVSSLFTASI